MIAHSLGVVLARKVIKGGELIATDGNCSLGRAKGKQKYQKGMEIKVVQSAIGSTPFWAGLGGKH